MSYINFYTYKLRNEQLDALYIRNLIVFLLLLSSDGRRIRISGDYTADQLTKQRTNGVVTAGVEGIYSIVERAVTRAHSTMSLYNLHKAVDDNAAASGHRHCSIYTFNWVAMGWAGNEDRGGVSTAATTSLSPAIVAGRNMLRRRCYGPETSASPNVLSETLRSPSLCWCGARLVAWNAIAHSLHCFQAGKKGSSCGIESRPEQLAIER
jgi:hypothetical protein